jgi:MFS family permease
MIKDRKIIYLVGFLFSIPIALTAYINSTFLTSFVGEKLVGTIYMLGSVGSILALFTAPVILRKIGGYKFLLLATLVAALSMLALSFVTHALSIFIIFILLTALNTLIIFSLDELLKIFSKESSTGKIRGIYMALCNLAWILAQVASGTILGGFSFTTMYFIGFVVMMLFFLIVYLRLKKMPNPEYDRINITKYLRKFFQKKNLFRAYGISFLLQFFYSWMVIYTPIYLFAHMGFSWKEISIMFAIMILPFSIIPFHLGKYADKVGERKILMFGFAIATFATFSLFFIEGQKILVWTLFLFMTRVGAATIEVMSDAYFFKHIKPENEEFIGVYRSVAPVAYILGPLVALGVFAFVPSFHFIYIILGTLMLYGVYISSTIKKGDI